MMGDRRISARGCLRRQRRGGLLLPRDPCLTQWLSRRYSSTLGFANHVHPQGPFWRSLADMTFSGRRVLLMAGVKPRRKRASAPGMAAETALLNAQPDPWAPMVSGADTRRSGSCDVADSSFWKSETAEEYA
jgi:hypothetical protein